MVVREHPNYVTTAQAAEILGKSPTTVRAMVRRGELDVQKPGGRFILYREQVERAAAQQD